MKPSLYSKGKQKTLGFRSHKFFIFSYLTAGHLNPGRGGWAETLVEAMMVLQSRMKDKTDLQGASRVQIGSITVRTNSQWGKGL